MASRQAEFIPPPLAGTVEHRVPNSGTAHAALELNRVFQHIDPNDPHQGNLPNFHNIAQIDPWNFFQMDSLPQEETQVQEEFTPWNLFQTDSLPQEEAQVQEEFTPSKPSTLPYVPGGEDGGFRSRITMRPPRAVSYTHLTLPTKA